MRLLALEEFIDFLHSRLHGTRFEMTGPAPDYHVECYELGIGDDAHCENVLFFNFYPDEDVTKPIRFQVTIEEMADG